MDKNRYRTCFMNATIWSRVLPAKFLRIEDSSSITQTKSDAFKGAGAHSCTRRFCATACRPCCGRCRQCRSSGLVDELESHGQRRQNQNPLVGLLHDVPGNRQLHQGFAKASITEQSHAPLAHGLGDDGLLEVKRTFRHPHRVESELSGAVLLVDMNVS